MQWGGVFDGPSDDASVAAIASWHANSVRLGLNEDCWLGINGLPVNGLTAQAYQQAVKDYVARLHAHGLYAILELHWSAPGTIRANSQEAMADQDHSPAFWSQVATAFKSDPATVFDLFNEPVGIDWNCWRDGCLHDGTSWVPSRGMWQTAGTQQLINAVRATGATNPIALGGLSFANDLSGWLSHQPTDPSHSLFASFHTYPFNPCSNQACWDSQVAPVAAQVPVVTGEMGGTSLINSYMSWADSKGISYLAWVWDTWGCGETTLISDYVGTACSPYGSTFRQHLGG